LFEEPEIISIPQKIKISRFSPNNFIFSFFALKIHRSKKSQEDFLIFSDIFKDFEI